MANLPIAVPLRKREKDGRLYARPPEVEAVILDLSHLTKEEFIKRLKAEDSDDYVPSECLIYFVRRAPFESDSEVLFALFTAI